MGGGIDIGLYLESDGYYHVCLDCKYRFNYIDDYCPNCGGENIEEDGLIENCNETKASQEGDGT